MVDLPTRSIIVSGLEHWQTQDPQVSQIINEPRLQSLLERTMREAGRLDAGKSITLRTPPVNVDSSGHHQPDGVSAMVFPTLFVCERNESPTDASLRRRRLVRWEQLDAGASMHKYRMPDNDKLVAVSPIRFVGACERGHIEDVDWRWAIHRGEDCSRPMFLEERGTSGSPADTAIACECGKRITLQDTTIIGRLGPCRGRRPWLGRGRHETCQNQLRLLTRSATNTYFPQVATLISLPQGDDELAKAVDSVWMDLRKTESFEELKTIVKISSAISGALSRFNLERSFKYIQSRQQEETSTASTSPRVAEFDLLGSGNAIIGNSDRESRLFAITLPRETWEGLSRLDLSLIRNIVAIHRLREVTCLYGFTRFEPAPTIEDDIEEVRLAVSGAPISETLEWLPAIEQFGEGVFIHFEPSKIAEWFNRVTVKSRSAALNAGFERWRGESPSRNHLSFPGLPYMALHTLAHALMIEIALESGYPASSIKERIYALQDRDTEVEFGRFGVLIYTASTGAQGTLGGLVATASRIAQILERSLARIEICSNDPVCADHSPDNGSRDRNLHGAACHGCLLVAETSCEKRNEYLDRALLVETMSGDSAALFRHS